MSTPIANIERPATAPEFGLMAGSPPPADKLVTLANWELPPFNRWGFLHVRDLIPTARIGRGDGPVTALPRDERELGDLTFPFGGEEVTLAGVLASRGALATAVPVTEYVEELRGSSFEGCTVQHLLDMRAGTSFNEDPDADVCIYEQVAGWAPRTRPSLVQQGGRSEVQLPLPKGEALLVPATDRLIADRATGWSPFATEPDGTHQGPAGEIGNGNRSSVPGLSTQALRTSPEKYTFSLTVAGRNARATTRCFFIEFSAENGWERVSLTRVPRSPWRMEFGRRRVSHASR